MVTVGAEAPGRRARSSAAPALPPGFVRRQRLHAAVDRAIEQPLTVVAAPAGCGKTVLLSAWAAERDAAWISIGPEHGDPSRLKRDLDRAWRLTSGRPTALVLDDVQLLDTSGLAVVRATIREADGPLIVASRSDPDLGLPRLRLEGRLAELRGADLAFTEPDLVALLEAVGLELSADRRQQLLFRTDGWAAGIRLMAVALLESTDPDRMLDEFSGDDQVVADYLTDEVLAALPRDVRDFLLRTSIVERLDVDLACELTERDDAAAVLDRLERQGAFVVALDRRRRCYRYHALLAELLRARLRLEQPRIVPALNERAAEWFAEHREHDLAVRHAVAAGSRARAWDVLAAHWLDLIAGGQSPQGEVPRDDARLAVAIAHGRLAAGDRTGARARLRTLDATGLVGALAALVRAYATHDIAGVRRAARAALARVSGNGGGDDDVARAIALQLLGAGELAAGALEVARERLEEAAALAAIPGRERVRLDCLGRLAAVEVVRGRLSCAQEQAHAALDIAHRHGWEHAPAAGWAVAAEAAVAWLRNDVAGAERRADAGAAAASADGEALLGDALRAVRAHLHAARGDDDAARALLRIVRDAHPEAGGLVARWLEALGPAPWAPSSGEGAAEITARAMRQLRDGDRANALRLAVAQSNDRASHPTVRLSALLVEAVAREALGEPGSAAALERALEVGQAEGLRRPFIDAGAPLRAVLHRHAELRTARMPLLTELLDALPATTEHVALEPVEPLSERERAVLRLLPTILPNGEIAGELFVSVNTVKTHLRSIYRKLDVGSRRDAVVRARALRLL
jgi:LuxR family maltose regulon positive regulatory protein